MAHKTENDVVIIEEGILLIRGVKKILQYAKEEEKDMAKYKGVEQSTYDAMAAESISKVPSLKAIDTQRKIFAELFKDSTPIIRKIHTEQITDPVDEGAWIPNPDLGSFAETDAEGNWVNLDGVTGQPVVVLNPANL